MELETMTTSLAGIVLPDAKTGLDVDLGREGRVLATLIRHRYWLPCQQHLVQVQARRDEFGAAAFELLAIGFSPVDALAPLAEHLSWKAPFCSDVDRLVYGRLELGRAGTLQVFNAGTRAIYRDAVASGEQIHRPVEDIRQLGGDVLIVDGVARLLARPASPDDRPSVEELLAGAQSLAAN